MMSPQSGLQEDQLGRALLNALRNAGVAVLYQDKDLKTVWARNMLAPWVSHAEGGGLQNFLPETQSERIEAARRNVIASGNSERFEISIPGENGVRWFEIWVDPDFDRKGEVQGILTTKVETTEQKRREQTLKTLLREVSHRSKNLLAIIQSIASQTGRHSDSISDFLTRFRGRLQSLASSQDLVTSSNWRGAELRELVAGQVARYGADPEHSLRFEGANPFLNPNAALHIGLAMHELAVNSVSYGALSQPNGSVAVTAGLNGTDGETSLSLIWSERLPGTERKRGRKRFGSVALERVVPVSLNGTATLDIANEHLNYTLVVPHGNFETE
ncbi:sensor histidine kinase [Mesorhizobium sp. SP-1A]|uniref:sensor histidine kinase n=1 Tax=Mesorhizobium sp. SP-1A TaxID=3077840 RepID=UPI0039657562